MITYTQHTSGKTEAYTEKLTSLLNLAAHLIAEEGYHKASIRKVAKAANLSISTLYHYFREKDQLLFLIQYHTFDSLVQKLKEKLESIPSPEKKLFAMIENQIEHFIQHMDELKVCSRELEALSGTYYQKVFQKRREYFNLTLKIMEELKKKFNNPDLDSRLATLFLFGMLNWIYMWYKPSAKDSYPKMVKQMYNLVISGIKQSC